MDCNERKGHALARYSVLMSEVFELFLEAQTSCVHFSAYLNRPDVLSRFKALVDDEASVRRRLAGDEETLPFRDAGKHREQIERWREEVRKFDPNSIPAGVFDGIGAKENV